MDHQDLAGIALFEGMSDDELQACAEHFETKHMFMGDELTKQKDFGYSFFVVLDGSVAVLIGDEQVAELGPGDHFGEMSLVHGETRNATVKAIDSGRVAKMMTWDFKELMEANPLLATRIESVAQERSTDP